MLEKPLSRCPVCDSEIGDNAFCENCGTTLVDGVVKCEACGSTLEKLSFKCGNCGATKGKHKEEKTTSEKEEAIKSLLLVPGLTRENASDLYDKGVKDFSTLVGMSLNKPERGEKMHKTIARRIMIMDGPDGKKKDHREKVECVTCRAMTDALEEKCEICGNLTPLGMEIRDKASKEDSPSDDGACEEIEHDAAFRGMPEDFQKELSKVLREPGDETDELNLDEHPELGDEVKATIKELDELLVEKEDEATVEEPAQEVIIVCPLCETEVRPDATSCHGCGAKFTEA